MYVCVYMILCMCVYIHICIYVYINIYTYTYVYIYRLVCVCICIFIYTLIRFTDVLDAEYKRKRSFKDDFRGLFVYFGFLFHTYKKPEKVVQKIIVHLLPRLLKLNYRILPPRLFLSLSLSRFSHSLSLS